MTSHQSGSAVLIVGIGTTATNISGAIQSIDHSSDAQMVQDKNGYGDTMAITTSDETTQKGSLDYITTTKPPVLPTIGGLITTTDADDSTFAFSNWIVLSWAKTRSNDGHGMKIKAEVIRTAGVTS